MLKPSLLLLGSLLWYSIANGQVFQRELGDFDLKLATGHNSECDGLITLKQHTAFINRLNWQARPAFT